MPNTLDMLRRPPSREGVPPRYQVFDRRKSPPQTVGRFYFDPERESVVIEVYDDIFREFLKREEPFADRRFDWVLDVPPDAPHDTRVAIVEPSPMPAPTRHGAEETEPLTLEEAVAGCHAPAFYRVIRTSDPV